MWLLTPIKEGNKIIIRRKQNLEVLSKLYEIYLLIM